VHSTIIWRRSSVG